MAVYCYRLLTHEEQEITRDPEMSNVDVRVPETPPRVRDETAFENPDRTCFIPETQMPMNMQMPRGLPILQPTHDQEPSQRIRDETHLHLLSREELRQQVAEAMRHSLRVLRDYESSLVEIR
jgi:hypothetical protein